MPVESPDQAIDLKETSKCPLSADRSRAGVESEPIAEEVPNFSIPPA